MSCVELEQLMHDDDAEEEASGGFSGSAWRLKPVVEWNSDEVLCWLYDTAGELQHVQLDQLRGERFQGLCGAQLCSMTPDDFRSRDHKHGQLLYDCLQLILHESVFSDVPDQQQRNITTLLNLQHNNNNHNITTTTLRLCDVHSQDQGEAQCVEELIDESFWQTLLSDPHDQPTDDITSPNLVYTQPCPTTDPGSVSKTKRRNRRQSSTASSSTSSSTASDVTSHVPRKRRTAIKKRVTHLWEFMRALLDSSEYNPVCVRWENEADGVFRIVPGQSARVARLWGAKKKNRTMTFEKMSRSLRWCREHGFFSDVPKDGQYPKKLCFRFGDLAQDSQRIHFDIV